jgi:hypothetical protein
MIPLCSSKFCKNPTLSVKTLWYGLCDKHIKLLNEDNVYIGICWDCNSITMVGKKTIEIPDKYLFSKGCEFCKNEDLLSSFDDRGIKWMTVKHWRYPAGERPSCLSDICVGPPKTLLAKEEVKLYPTFWRRNGE